MKFWVFALAAITLLTFVGCGGGSTASTSPVSIQNPTPAPTTRNWIWIAGSNMANQGGTYGTQGTAAAGNTPGGRYGGATWIDASGNLWLFGGEVAPSDTDNYLNDLWKYSGGQWTWIGGSNSYNQKGAYGSQGIASPGNTPGGRSSAATWKDLAGNFWLFGGLGLDADGPSEALNDLWEYSAGQWTWIAGPTVAIDGHAGIYGTRKTAAPGNIPGARQSAVSWADQSGNFWLFGGLGFDSTGTVGYLSDLWKYSGGEWTWMGGANVVYQPASYGIRGTPASSNDPGARYEAVGWTDAAGNFWLFGGTLGPEGHYELLNDLWKYSNGEWTWIAGSNAVNQPGTYGIQGTAAPDNAPGARVVAAGWADSAGNFWIFWGRWLRLNRKTRYPERSLEIQCRPMDVDSRIKHGRPAWNLRDTGGNYSGQHSWRARFPG